MSNLFLNKEIVSYYKEIKDIKYDADLLKKIGSELGYKSDVLEYFVKSQKGNFSKIIKGARPLNKDYIVPLEKIFGVPVAKLIEPEAYNYLINKENIPFLKGIKYYAYMDDMDLYYNELSKNTDNQGKSIIFNKDEFGRTFLDYVVEYKSVNAIKYLYETYHLKLKWYDNYFYVNGERFIDINFCNSVLFARMVADMKDTKLFFDIYDTYNMFVTNGHYGGKGAVYEQDDFLKIILDNENLFNDIFKTKEYLHVCSNIEKRKYKVESYSINTTNPIINGCLRCAVNNLDKYMKQAMIILNFAEKHNANVINKLEDNNYIYRMNDLGGIYSKEDDIIDILIYSNIHSKDQRLEQLLRKLPTNENGYFNYYIYKNINS